MVAKQWRTAARWARWSVLTGTALMLLSGASLVTVDRVLARYESAIHNEDLFGDKTGPARPRPEDIKGPLNVLLAGIDPRRGDPTWIPRADSVLVMHVPAGLDRGYLFSLPRDLLVAIPPFPKSGYAGNPSDKLAHAMYFGSMVPGDPNANYAQGFELLAATVSQYTGIARFDAGAIIDFSGFKDVIDALGGIDMTVDERVASIHLEPDGDPRDRVGGSYVGEQMVYEPGLRHFKGWQALDYARQRYVTGGDYARQRHQQQLVRAMIAKGFSADVLADPLQLDEVLRAAGDSLTFSGRGHGVIDWAFAMQDIRPSRVAMIKLSGGGVGRYVVDKGKDDDEGDDGGGDDGGDGGDDDDDDDKKDKKKKSKPKMKYQYLGEQLDLDAKQFLAAVAAGAVENYLAFHPELINN